MKRSAVLVLLLAFLFSLSACGGADAPAAGDPAVVLTDMTGHEIRLDAPAKRVVALTAADCEILCAIGAQDCLVGRGEYCDWPESIASVPSVASGYEMNIEQIIALQPQVLLMGSMSQSEEQIAQLQSVGICVVQSDAQNIDGVYRAISMIGTLVGKTAEADRVIADMQSVFDSLRSEPTGKSIYFEVSPLAYGLWTAGKDTFMDEIAQMLGLENCFGDVSGWCEISQEQVIARNPDYILTISMFADGEGSVTDEILGRSGWENVTAVRDGRILNLVHDELSRPGPRLADGAKALYDFVCGK